MGSNDPSRGAPGDASSPSAADVRARVAQHEAKHPPKPAPSGPDPGKVLLRAQRSDGTELRVSLHAFEGKSFVRVAPWQRGSGDTWWPVKGKGCTVKVRELARVTAALADAMDATADEDK